VANNAERVVMTPDTFRLFLADLGHPWELVIHHEDFRLLRLMLPQHPETDAEGPYLWFEATRIRTRPPSTQSRLDISDAQKFEADSAVRGWRGSA
jgi:hypothetical protein